MRATLSFFLKQTTVKSYSTTVFAAAMLLLCITTLTRAQDDSNPKRGFYPGGSYSIGDIEAINTANGNLLLNIPIASLPAGRGGAKGPGISLTYNSKLWDVQPMIIPGDPETGGTITFHDLVPGLNGGWRYNLPVYTLQFDEFVPNGTNCNGGYVHKVSVVFPDGGVHEFYPAGFTIKNSTGGVKFSQIRADGWKASSVQTGGDCFLSYSLQTSSTMTYFSVDGTYLRLDIMHDSDQDPGNNPWTLYFPDGQRVESSVFSSGFPDLQRTYDRNNNYTEFQRIHNYNGQTNRTADKLVDEFGRSLLLDYGDPSVLNPTATITMAGVNNEELRWTINWNSNELNIINKSYCDHFATGGTCDSFMDLDVSVHGIDQINLPVQLGGLAYHFGYNATTGGWGELSSMTVPSGAVSSYHYEQDGLNQIAWHKVKDNAVARKDISYQLEYDLNSTATTDSWLYSYNHTTGVTTITAPDNGTTTASHFTGTSTLLGDSAKGSVYKTVRPDGSIEEDLWQINVPAGIVEFSNQPIKVNPFIKAKFVSITNSLGQPVKTSVQNYSYDKNGNVTAVAEYDWIDYSSIQRDATTGQPLDVAQQPALTTALLKRLTTTSYLNPTPDSSDTTTISANAYSRPGSPALRAFPSATQSGTGSQVQARSDYAYDSAGNVTQMLRWDSTKAAYSNPLTTANSLTSSNQYATWASGATGKLTLTTDPRGIQTRFTYGTVGAVTDLYPTTVETAYGTPVQRTENREYDFYTGLITKTTDADNSISTKMTYDVFGRLTLVQEAFGTTSERQTATQYFDAERRVVTRSDLATVGDGKILNVKHFDQLGRVRLSRQVEDASVSQADVLETVGIKVQSRYLYASGNTYALQSNPYRANTSQQAGSETSMGWMRTKSDVVGRVVEKQTFAGTGLPAPWGTNTTSTGTVTTLYDSYLTTITDQTQKKRRSKVDALGRLIRVDEPVMVGANPDLGDGENPLQPTSYTYDALGNLTNVSQGNQSRIFTYSSLSRLLSAQTPESGVTSYKYDEDGNLRVKTDARLVSAHFTYDQLNRVTRRWYNSTSAVEDTPSNETLPSGVGVSPQVNFVYDAHPATSPFFSFQSQDKSKGLLTAVTYGLNSTTGDYYRYDLLGRAFTKIQRIGAQDYQVTAQYNRANVVLSLTYPSGHVVTNTLDTAARLSAMSGNLGDGTSRTYSTGILYSPYGALVKEQFGTTAAIYNKLFYNSRGQLAEIRESTSYTGADDTTFDRGAIVNHYSDLCAGRCAPDVNGFKAMTDDNGTVKKQEIYIPGSDTRTQLYVYDELNRLKSVRETKLNTDQWRQWFQYDRFGNRTIDNTQDSGDPHTRTWGAGINNTSFTVNLNNDNRLGVPSGQNKIMHYDAAGNLDNDTYTGAGNRTYDAENRITSAFGGVAPGQAELYTYDSSGQRVKRAVDGVETWMVYGLSGEMVAEYPSNIAATTPQKEYGYRNGTMLIAAEAGSSSAAPVFSDNFDDNSLNASSWTVYYPGSSPTVSEQSQQLQMTLSPNTAAYNGVFSNATYDLTNRMVQVESVQSVSQAGWCENFLEVELNANNYFMIQVGAGNMLFRSRVNAVNDQTSIPFDGLANRFWRVRHDQNSNQIFFETSANGTVWLTRKTVTAGFAVTSLRFHLLAGAWGTGNSSPGAAKYDNFKLLASSAPTSLTVPNAGFEAPVLGNGNFQYSPTGGSWTFAAGGGISGMNSPFTGVPSAAPDGVQVAFIQAGGTVQQSISGFQANANYVITFSAIQRTNCCNTTGQDIAVYIDNTLVGTFHPSNTAYVEYSTAPFSTSTGAHVVKFAGLNVNGDQTAFMDKVRITGNPKPGFGVEWLVADQLGTPRMIFDETGSLANVKRHDYLPFGEELFAGVSGRTVTEGYGSGDGVRQQFTGKERDVETGLDYFLARYYSSTQGRFTSPDPYKIVAEVQNEPDPEKARAMFIHYLLQPQLWNQYAYTLNNPLKFTDPTGETVELTGTELEQQEALARIRAMLGEERFALLRITTVNGHIQLSIAASDVQRFAAIGGGNSDERAFSAGMAGILVRTSIVEYRIATEFQYKDENGKVHTGYTGNGCFLSQCGHGGITLPPTNNASGNGNWQIFVNPNAGKVATTAAAGMWELAGGKGSLVTSNDEVDAHEFGHVWETWQGPSVVDSNPRTKPYLLPDSVIFENAIRSRYPSPLRRTRH